jgi:hypothetical protein
MDPDPRGEVTTSPSATRPRPRSLRSGAFFVGLMAVLAAPVVGQEGQDTIPPREARERPPIPQDTVGQDTVDSIPPPPSLLPPLETGRPTGWAQGVWEWDRDDLMRRPDLSLLDLLERIPGVVPVRADLTAQPEAGAIFGAAAGAVEYIVDGFALDPLTSPTFDPSRISLLALRRVRVERRVTGATVRIQTLAPDDGRTKSVIEAGTGDYSVNVFRGIFLPPRVFSGALGLGFERLAADGFVPGSANHTVSWLKWTWAQDSLGVQVEYRHSTMNRTGVGEAVVSGRTDWAVRARGALGPVTAEAYSGATSLEDEPGEEGGTVVREGTPQVGLRLGTALEGAVPVDALVSYRFRDHPRLPGHEATLDVRARPAAWLTLEGGAKQGWWSPGDNTGRWNARAVLGPWLGAEVFGEVVRGGPPLGAGPELALPPPVDSASFRVTRDGVRAGLRYSLGQLDIGGAVLQVSADTVYPFGLPMESEWAGLQGGDVQGIEAMARLPTGIDPITVQGWYVGMDAPEQWLYLPRHHWRAGLVYHHLPLPSGNLELFVRLEHVFRGAMSVPAAADSAGAPPYTRVGAYRSTDLELVIRVLTVRAFLRWYNVEHRLEREDLPGFTKPGQHILWGVKWEFWN